MKFKKIEDVESFLKVINQCEHDVWLESVYGDKFNLKSQLSQYVAMGALLGERGDELELFCQTKADEARLLNYFESHPQVL